MSSFSSDYFFRKDFCLVWVPFGNWAFGDWFEAVNSCIWSAPLHFGYFWGCQYLSKFPISCSKITCFFRSMVWYMIALCYYASSLVKWRATYRIWLSCSWYVFVYSYLQPSANLIMLWTSNHHLLVYVSLTRYLSVQLHRKYLKVAGTSSLFVILNS